MASIFKKKNVVFTQPGFTLLETLVALGIFILVVGSIVTILSISFKTKDTVFEQLTVQNEGRKAVQDFVNEVRSATFSSIGAYPLELASSTEIVFYSNIDSDTSRERVHYILNGTTLKKGVVKPTGNPLTYVTSTEVLNIVVHSVATSTGAIFTYYDQNFTGTSTPLAAPVNVSQVRLIGINLTLDKNPNVSPTAFKIQAKGEIRNLKTN